MTDWRPDYEQLARQARQQPVVDTARNTRDAARALHETVGRLDRSAELQLETLQQTRKAATDSDASARRAMRHSLITGYTSVGLGLASLVVAVIALFVANGA
ncbi:MULTISPECIES: hypothetical protein [unclassified Curtobacterium]|uniref:hypothetical protein n=1 Tax=unclassified Curtobacterium TaxID=257496 RepID=UPI0039AED0C0